MPKRKTGPPKDASHKAIKAPKVEVLWVDATSHAGWFDVEEALEKQPVLMHTMGYLIEKNKKFVKLVRSVEDKGDAIGDPFIIPNDWVRKVRKVK